jgi:multiple sugar transport system permease protein
MAREMQGISLTSRLLGVLRQAGLYLLLAAIGITMVLPLVWMISTSLKEPQAVFTLTPQWIPRPVHWASYVEIWRVVPFLRFFLNSVVVAVCVTAGHVFSSACAAYAFARLRFPGREPVFFAYIATMMIPGSVTIIPVFILMKWFGWIDTYWALIVPGIFNAFGTFLLRQFFLTIPQDLEDAAKIDGASPFRIFWRIILPVSKPALAALTIATFMGNWQSFMWPLLVVDSVEKKTLPIGLAYFQELYQFASPNWPLLMAGSLVAMLPIVLLFIFNQRFFLQGIRLTGVQR